MTSPIREYPADWQSAEELLAVVYDQLRQLAARRLDVEAASQTLQPTALVHEAWLSLGGSDGRFKNRDHFLAAASEAMRKLLVDRARKRQCVRHGGQLTKVDLDSVDLALTTDDETLLRLDEALERLAKEAPEKASLVKLRYFTGLTIQEAAQTLGIAPATANRHWAFARAWLFAELQDG